MQLVVGMTAICKKNIQFTDGTVHYPGFMEVITPSTLAYYQVCAKDYDFEWE